MLASMGYPLSVVPPTSPLVASGARASGQLAWDVVSEICQRPHPYNSDENLRVRRLLLGQIRTIQSAFGAAQCKSPDASPSSLVVLDQDTMSTVSNYSKSAVVDLFESSNILVRVRGRSPSHEALLVSAHFDSVPSGPGVTDDGIAIGSMVAVLKSLLNHHCHSPLMYDVIFNFNNAEEMGLFGATAFVRHPWFKDVKAFINLEGTGTTGSERSMLFRTNSFEVTSAYMAKAPYPHASILVNNLMRFVGSETDYRPYTVEGRRQGIDIAFYTNRYLYHTARDDLQHAKPIAAQHMADDLLKTALGLTAGPSALGSLEPSQQLPMGRTNVLPVPSFAFYDVYGFRGVLKSYPAYLLSLLAILVASIVIASIKLTSLYYRLGYKRLVLRGIKPFFEAYALVWFVFLSVILASYSVSSIKHYFSPGATYAHPLLTLAYTVPLIISMFALIQIIWPPIAVRLMLRNRAAPAMYHELPSAPPPLDQYDDESDGSEDEHAEEDVVQVDQPVPDAGGSVHASRPSTTGAGITARRAPQPSQPLRPRSPRHRLVESDGPSLASWLPFGLLGFWLTLLFVNIVLTLHGISAFFFLFTWPLYSFIACALTLGIESSLRRWYRSGFDVISSTDDQHVPSRLENSLLSYYEQYFWLVNFGIATIVPFMETLDTLQSLLNGLPSLIGDGLPGVIIDLAVTQQYMETWDVTNATTAALSSVASVIMLPIVPSAAWIAMLKASPSFKSVLSNSSVVCVEPTDGDKLRTCTIDNLPLPKYNATQYKPIDLIGANLEVRNKARSVEIEGVIVGPPDSRICSLSLIANKKVSHSSDLDGTPNEPDADGDGAIVKTARDTAIRGMWIDPWQANKWTGPNNTAETPRQPTPGLDYSLPMIVYRREYEGLGLSDHRVRIPFLAQLDLDVDRQDAQLTIACYVDQHVGSSAYQAVVDSVPTWMQFSNGLGMVGRNGALEIRKTFPLMDV
ncbi:hypothetical protein BC831DRAFT_465617 [Entophlyctis helioformis]|nr:hypothetical protein BC831DRAFT_465617 [Entophlyctis helioformis]